MKLLIVTQTVDTEDPVLGFFVRWVEEFARAPHSLGEVGKHVEHIDVICLKLGRSDLPENVQVLSLGKENGAASRAVYAWRFLALVWKLRGEYDAVFVHMNQEYILIAGWLWKLLQKRMYLWRNHFAGSLQTDIAAAFCTKVFCTSKHSYTAKYKKTVLMPVGIDTKRFKPDEHIQRKSHSILFLSRMSPSKRPEMLIDALAELAQKNVDFTASLVGSPLPRDEAYYEGLKEKVRSLGLADQISFHPGIPNDQTPNLYRSHEIFINTSPSGMLDKTMFEAAACGCIVLSSSADFAELAGHDSYFESSTELAERLTSALAHPSASQSASLVEANSLVALGYALQKEIYSGCTI